MSDCVTGSIDVMDVNLEQRKLIDELRSKICEHNWHLLHELDNIEQCTICRLYRDREAEYPSEAQTRRIVELEAELDALKKAAQAVVNELEDCWEHTPNKLEFIIGELATLLEEDK